jgi:hypothetical protein
VAQFYNGHKRLLQGPIVIFHGSRHHPLQAYPKAASASFAMGREFCKSWLTRQSLSSLCMQRTSREGLASNLLPTDRAVTKLYTASTNINHAQARQVS